VSQDFFSQASFVLSLVLLKISFILDWLFAYVDESQLQRETCIYSSRFVDFSGWHIDTLTGQGVLYLMMQSWLQSIFFRILWFVIRFTLNLTDTTFLMTNTYVTWIWDAGSLVLCYLMRFFAWNAPRFGAFIHVWVFS
jgi:hypothetical protein